MPDIQPNAVPCAELLRAYRELAEEHEACAVLYCTLGDRDAEREHYRLSRYYEALACDVRTS